VRILKLHGSLDWFNKAEYNKLVNLHADEGLGKPKDAIFGRDDITTSPLLDGPRVANDPLQEMHRIHNVETLYKNPPMFLAAPWLLNPSAMKLLFAGPVRDFWGEVARDGLLNLGLAIIGYSLPTHDDYARQVVYRLVENYQSPHWDEKAPGQEKNELVLIDHRLSAPSQEEFKKRYRFVDWDKTHCCFDGFCEDVLPVLFPPKK
jgi:hypothetical protein